MSHEVSVSEEVPWINSGLISSATQVPPWSGFPDSSHLYPSQQIPKGIPATPTPQAPSLVLQAATVGTLVTVGGIFVSSDPLVGAEIFGLGVALNLRSIFLPRFMPIRRNAIADRIAMKMAVDLDMA